LFLLSALVLPWWCCFGMGSGVAMVVGGAGVASLLLPHW